MTSIYVYRKLYGMPDILHHQKSLEPAVHKLKAKSLISHFQGFLELLVSWMFRL
jgi:hypothetical protein